MSRLFPFVVAMILCACGSTPPAEATPEATPTATEEPSDEPTPRPTPEPATGGMPTEFEDKLCLALNQLGEATQDIVELGDAAAVGDLDRVSLMAYAAGGFATTVQVALLQTPAWEPGSGAVNALSSLTDDLVAGLELIDVGATEGNDAKITEGSRLVGLSATALTEVRPELQRLVDDFGLGCVLP